MHFLIEDALAAPESGLPSLLTALASQAEVDCAAAGAVIEPKANSETSRAPAISFNIASLQKVGRREDKVRPLPCHAIATLSQPLLWRRYRAVLSRSFDRLGKVTRQQIGNLVWIEMKVGRELSNLLIAKHLLDLISTDWQVRTRPHPRLNLLG